MNAICPAITPWQHDVWNMLLIIFGALVFIIINLMLKDLHR